MVPVSLSHLDRKGKEAKHGQTNNQGRKGMIMDTNNETMKDFLEQFKVEKTRADGTRYDMYIIPLKNVRAKGPEIEKEMGNG